MSGYLTPQMLGPESHRNNENLTLGLFRRWFLAAVRHWQRRRMTQALERLDDRMLADIGVHRSEISHLVGRFDPQELRMVPLGHTVPDAHSDFHAYRIAA